MISSLEPEMITFGQGGDIKMPVDKARDTVKKMAKRSMGKRP